MSVYRSNSAPKTIQRIWIAVITPTIDAAPTYSPGMPQKPHAMSAATTHAIGIARVAGHSNPTSKIPTSTSGVAANSISSALTIDLTSTVLPVSQCRVVSTDAMWNHIWHGRRTVQTIFIIFDRSSRTSL